MSVRCHGGSNPPLETNFIKFFKMSNYKEFRAMAEQITATAQDGDSTIMIGMFPEENKVVASKDGNFTDLVAALSEAMLLDKGFKIIVELALEIVNTEDIATPQNAS